MTLRTILVVDDERPVRDLLVAILTRQGFAVRAAASAEEAARLEREQPVDLLITDVMLPEMSGPDLARVVRERSPSTRVLFMSGYAGALLKEQDLQDAEFLQKPFDAKAVAQKIRDLLNPNRE